MKPEASESPEEPGSEPEPEPSWSQGSYYDIFGPDFPNAGKTGLNNFIHILIKLGLVNSINTYLMLNICLVWRNFLAFS